MDERGDFIPRRLVRSRCAFCEAMDAAVDIRVIHALLMNDRIQHGLRALSRRRIVEISERLATDVLFKRGKVVAQPCDRIARLGV
jgi:hypothetical protein